VFENAYLTAPDGPMVGDVRLADGWAWIVVALGAAFIALGGLLLSVLG